MREVVTHIAPPGRLQTQTVFSAKPGPTSSIRTERRPINASRLHVDEGMIRHIKRSTDPSWLDAEDGHWL